MKLYDEVIAHINETLSAYQAKTLPVGETNWSDVGKAKMILRSEMAYELGGDRLPALGSTIVTNSQDLVPQDEIVLYGPDLPEITKDQPYARITFVRTDESAMGEGNDLYNAIHRIEYFRYHVFPEGFMMRVSAASERECVRVGSEALDKGLDFAKIGNFMIDALHVHKDVQAVKVIFVTLPEADYDSLREDYKMTKKITDTIDHMLKDVNMDCNSCSLQEVCDEVEGMKELHFGISNSNK
ncbi:MAG: carbon monoxide dehydrogenase [Lachnospiraceae bacterium]|nr:carbon monoxide dehydrogenase [Lachnospiraceae bacterium]